MEMLFVTLLKYSSFSPSACVKPMSNDLVQAMPWQCSLNVFTVFTYVFTMIQPLSVLVENFSLDKHSSLLF